MRHYVKGFAEMKSVFVDNVQPIPLELYSILSPLKIPYTAICNRPLACPFKATFKMSRARSFALLQASPCSPVREPGHTHKPAILLPVYKRYALAKHPDAQDPAVIASAHTEISVVASRANSRFQDNIQYKPHTPCPHTGLNTKSHFLSHPRTQSSQLFACKCMPAAEGI